MIVVCAVVCALAVPAVALAFAPLGNGHWKITGGGGFTVNGRNVSGMHLSGTSCQLGKLTVLGSQRLRLSTQGGYTNWVIGTPDPSRKNPNEIGGIVPQKVKIRSGGKTIAGSVEIVFAVLGQPSDNTGVLTVDGCEIDIVAKR
jgi:hypothetical protein